MQQRKNKAKSTRMQNTGREKLKEWTIPRTNKLKSIKGYFLEWKQIIGIA